MTAVPVSVGSGKLRTVLDYLPCDACLTIASPDQDLLCSVCHRLHRDVAVKLVERRAVIVETPLPPPPPVEAISPAPIGIAEPAPGPAPAEASGVEPTPVEEPVVADALIAQERPAPETDVAEATLVAPEVAPPPAPVPDAPTPSQEADAEPSEAEDDFEFAASGEDDDDGVGFGTVTAVDEEADETFGIADAPDGDDATEAPFEIDPELLKYADSPPVHDLAPEEDDRKGEFTFTPPSRDEVPEETADAEVFELEEEDWLPEEGTASAPATPAREDDSRWAPPEIPDVADLTVPELEEAAPETTATEAPEETAAPMEETAVDEEAVVEMEVVDESEDVVEMEVIEDDALAASDAVNGLPIEALEGVGPAYATRLRDAGVERVSDLAGRDAWALAESTGISGKTLERWIATADFMAAGIPQDYADALARTNARTPDAFARADAKKVARDANLFLKGKPEVSPLDEGTVREWQARLA